LAGKGDFIGIIPLSETAWVANTTRVEKSFEWKSIVSNRSLSTSSASQTLSQPCKHLADLIAKAERWLDLAHRQVFQTIHDQNLGFEELQRAACLLSDGI
jgi:hypothetical protein